MRILTSLLYIYCSYKFYKYLGNPTFGALVTITIKRIAYKRIVILDDIEELEDYDEEDSGVADFMQRRTEVNKGKLLTTFNRLG